jgi:hypothetical protein
VLAPVLTLAAACSEGSTGPLPPVPTLIAIERPALVLAALGDTASVAATVYDEQGRPLPTAALTFSSDDPDVVGVIPTGVVTARGAGSATIRVRAGGVVAEATVVVFLDPEGAGAIIDAFPTHVPTGDGNQTVILLNAANSSLPGDDPIAYRWSATNGRLAAGPASPRNAADFPGVGSQRVRLEVENSRGVNSEEVVISVAPALPPAGTFAIEFVDVDGIAPPADVQAALERARARWQRVIRGDLPDVDFSTAPAPADVCFAGQPAFDDLVDDVRIYIDIAPIDGPGGSIGRAGPCFIRDGDGTVVVGRMSFDSEDLADLAPSELDALILHEMAHVFGFGTLWDDEGRNLLVDPSCPGGACSATDPPGPDTRYRGSLGRQAWRAFGGAKSDGGPPVENGETPSGLLAGAGTRDSHWREGVLGDELMTGFLDFDGNPLSYLTLAALEDLGYRRIDYREADAWQVPAFAPQAAAVRGASGPEAGASKPGGRGLRLHDDVWVAPIRVVGEDGDVVRVQPGR